MKKIFSILIALALVLGMSLVAVPVGVVGGSTATIDVSQPVQVTSDTHYERGQSIIYDGSNYWLFYGRSDSVTSPYGTGNPDTCDYKIYYKKASTVGGLAAATPTLLNNADNHNIFQGEISAATDGGSGMTHIWGAVDRDGVWANGSGCDLFRFRTNDGGASWSSTNYTALGVSGVLPDGAAHHAAVNFGGQLWLAWHDGSGWTSKYYSGGWSAQKDIFTGDAMGKFYLDGTNLYFVRATFARLDIYEWNGNTWSTSISGATESGALDPTIYKVGSNYICAYAPWVSPSQWIKAKVGTSLSTLLSGPTVTVDITAGGYGGNSWVDMWPTGFTDNSGDTYLFYTSERDPSDLSPSGSSDEIAGNIWYLEVDWPVTNDHYTYIQNAIDAASSTTINVAAGTYDGQITINKSLTLIGAGEDQTFLKATGLSPVITVSHDNVTIQDLEITDNTQLVEGIRIVSGASTGLTVDHVDFTEIGAGTGANAYGIYIANSFANLSVTNSDFVPVTHTTYHRTMGIFAPNSLVLSDFEVSDSTFQKIWTGIYLRSAIDGLDVMGNTFGQVDSWDFKACVAGIYIGDGDDNNFDIENVVVTDNTFTEYGRGVYVWNYASGGEIISNFEIYENTFTNSRWSSGIRFIGGLNTNDEQVSFDDINVHDNTFTQGFDVGAHVGMIDFRIYQELTACQIAVTDNEITFSGGPYTDPWSAIAFSAYDGPFKNTVVDGNILDGGSCGGGTGDPPSSGIRIIHEGSTYWPSDTLEMDIHCNDITGFDNGISIYDTSLSKYGRLPIGSDVDINYNNIHGNTLYGVRNGVSTSGEMVDAENNWWGDTDGSGPYDPSGESSETTDVPPCSVSVDAMMNPDGTGDEVQGRVDYCPWLGGALAPAQSVATTTGTGMASFTPSQGNIGELAAVATPSGTPILPHGAFSFKVCCIDPGQTITLTIVLPEPMSPLGAEWWKYHAGRWYSLPIDSMSGGNTITITLTDGVFPGDADSIPGQITDPGGPGYGVSMTAGCRLDILSTEGGSVTTPGEGGFPYDCGTVVDLVASPDAGYKFVNWTGEVRRIADVNAAATNITMRGNYKIIANFETEENAVEPQAQYELTVSTTTGGSVTTPGEGTFSYGEGSVVSLFASSDTGYKFVNWTGDSITHPDSATTTVTMNGDYSVMANFEETTGTDSGGVSSVLASCFIATAAYGTPTAEQIDVLREFRDVVLLESAAGSQFAALYYQLSPPIADFIGGNELLRTLVRELLVDPVVWIVEATGAIWRN